MNNYILIKKVFFMLLLIAVVYVLFLLANTFINKPVIKDIGTIALDEINITKSAGESDSSVIVKKANKEYLVKLGDSLDNNFELIEVLPNTAVFRNGNKIYRINKEEAK